MVLAAEACRAALLNEAEDEGVSGERDYGVVLELKGVMVDCHKDPSCVGMDDSQTESYWMLAASCYIHHRTFEEQAADIAGMRAVAILFADSHDEKLEQ